MSVTSSRRSFLKTAAAGSALLASTHQVHAERKRYKRKSPASTELMEIGMITTGGYSHADVWAKAMNPPLEEFKGDYLPLTDFRRLSLFTVIHTGTPHNWMSFLDDILSVAIMD